MFRARLLIASALLLTAIHPARLAGQAAVSPPETRRESCFLLYELGVGEVRRDPAEACRTPVTPASTFKVPHALAALDAGVVREDEVFAFDGRGDWPPSSRRAHTLASAIRNSVVWYFQRIAERLGPAREAAYLERLSFGNRDSRSGLTTFWLGGSLLISPEEQEAFWIRLFEGRLPIAKPAVEAVKQMLIEPPGMVVNAAGEHAFARPWPPGTELRAKTGSATDRSGRGVRWLVGHVTRNGRAYVFVNCVTGAPDLDALAAIDLAARALRASNVL